MISTAPSFGIMSVKFAQFEEDTLRYWREIDAFKTQLKLTEDGARFSFYDGPPFGMSPESRTPDPDLT